MGLTLCPSSLGAFASHPPQLGVGIPPTPSHSFAVRSSDGSNISQENVAKFKSPTADIRSSMRYSASTPDLQQHGSGKVASISQSTDVHHPAGDLAPIELPPPVKPLEANGKSHSSFRQMKSPAPMQRLQASTSLGPIPEDGGTGKRDQFTAVSGVSSSARATNGQQDSLPSVNPRSLSTPPQTCTVTSKVDDGSKFLKTDVASDHDDAQTSHRGLPSSRSMAELRKSESFCESSISMMSTQSLPHTGQLHPAQGSYVAAAESTMEFAAVPSDNSNQAAGFVPFGCPGTMEVQVGAHLEQIDSSVTLAARNSPLRPGKEDAYLGAADDQGMSEDDDTQQVWSEEDMTSLDGSAMVLEWEADESTKALFEPECSQVSSLTSQVAVSPLKSWPAPSFCDSAADVAALPGLPEDVQKLDMCIAEDMVQLQCTEDVMELWASLSADGEEI